MRWGKLATPTIRWHWIEWLSSEKITIPSPIIQIPFQTPLPIPNNSFLHSWHHRSIQVLILRSKLSLHQSKSNLLQQSPITNSNSNPTCNKKNTSTNNKTQKGGRPDRKIETWGSIFTKRENLHDENKNCFVFLGSREKREDVGLKKRQERNKEQIMWHQNVSFFCADCSDWGLMMNLLVLILSVTVTTFSSCLVVW